MSKPFVLAIDQGTTGSRAILYGADGKAASSAYQEFRQYYPAPAWVEHDAQEILSSVRSVIQAALRGARVSGTQIQAIGITNQRETVVFWDRKSGVPLGRAIVWQDRRTEAICQTLRKEGAELLVRQKTGLLLDPYFSGTKLKWRFDRDVALRRKARSGSVCAGTIDSWLLFHLTGKKVHATDFTNASRTLLFHLRKKAWDPALLELFHVPKAVLPEVKSSNSRFGMTKKFPGLTDGIPICSLLGDQQAALFGQGCYEAGESKNTYGTGCFILVNTGSRFAHSRSGLLTTLACDGTGNPVYALEGSIFIAGAAIQWLRDGLGIIKKASETEAIARSVRSSDEVVVIPAFTGLGAPYWRPDVRGAIFGITRGTSREMIVKAALDSIAFQVKEVFDLMEREGQVRIPSLKVDGGASGNRYLMQLQADLIGIPILRTHMSESTAWGTAKLAGLVSGFWTHLKKLDSKIGYERFTPKINSSKRKILLARWKSAVARLIGS